MFLGWNGILTLFNLLYSRVDRLGGVEVERPPSGARGSGFYPRSGHTKDFKHGSNGCHPWCSWLQG